MYTTPPRSHHKRLAALSSPPPPMPRPLPPIHPGGLFGIIQSGWRSLFTPPLAKPAGSRADRWPTTAVTANAPGQAGNHGACPRSLPVNWLCFPAHGPPQPVPTSHCERSVAISWLLLSMPRPGARLPPCAWGERRAGNPVFMSG